jgi:hypothetical protein
MLSIVVAIVGQAEFTQLPLPPIVLDRCVVSIGSRSLSRSRHRRIVIVVVGRYRLQLKRHTLFLVDELSLFSSLQT